MIAVVVHEWGKTAIVRGKAVAPRLLIGGVVPIIGRNERAEGLEIARVIGTRHLKTPSGDVWSGAQW